MGKARKNRIKNRERKNKHETRKKTNEPSIHVSVNNNNTVDEIKEPRVVVDGKNGNPAGSTQNEIGLLGKIFGSATYLKNNVMGMIAILLTLTLCAYTLWNKFPPAEIFFTLLMTVFGYMFGKYE